eukprot:CAMPEP_0198252596 /NCGR_PEP_ID=MMETSP1447-20131203/3086_1 /TAXON_ID=420782 /ORGANISM="Chaetoceros dichaeta, Strain CCMP1751" /LENGTH=546 /DNA_ID=CAMNT_0043937915 /DNA_START=35 /DNA_END=1675 /DNA_ORIENTATION=+
MERAGEVTRVDKAFFENPVKRLGVSGGTAPFFSLKLTKEGKEKFGAEYGHNGTISETYFIGKDLSRAVDEVEFYEKTLLITKRDKDDGAKDDGGMSEMLGYTFVYLGVVTLEETVDGSPVERELLILKNLYDSLTKLRLLDFKMGERTADVNWRGKSRARAYKQRILDGFTNSTKQGFRLEGFDGQPQVVTSMNPLISARMSLQRMNGPQVLMHYLDLHDVPADENESLKDDIEETDCARKADVYTKSEVAEIVLHETVSQLVQLSAACHASKVPQKWLGSSVALGYDAGSFPPRSNSAEQSVRSNVIINIFDWGRSELLTKEAFDQLSTAEQSDRQKFWEYYICGIDELSRNAAKRYDNQFSNSDGWDEITVRVMDYDSGNEDDFMGEVTLPLPKIPLETTWSEEYPLRGKGKPWIRGRPKNGRSRGSIKLDISWWDAPKDSSRIKGSWHITIDQASNLQVKDIISSDPYCLVIARSKSFEFEQMTSVKVKSLDPVWGETFELPVASRPSVLLDSLRSSGMLSVEAEKFKGILNDEDDAAWSALF